MPRSVVVVTPVWRSQLSEDELIRLQITERATQSWERVILHPEGMPTSELRSRLASWTFQPCDPQRLSSVQSYSSWLLQAAFYKQFQGYDFMLIAQLDSVVLREPPAEAFGYDYLGAPWDPPWRVIIFGGQMRIIRAFGRMWGKKLTVGNGGLSIRRIDRFLEASQHLAGIVEPGVLATANEDAVWSYFARELGISLAPEELASLFLDIREDHRIEVRDVCGVHGLSDETLIANDQVRQYAIPK